MTLRKRQVMQKLRKRKVFQRMGQMIKRRGKKREENEREKKKENKGKEKKEKKINWDKVGEGIDEVYMIDGRQLKVEKVIKMLKLADSFGHTVFMRIENNN